MSATKSLAMGAIVSLIALALIPSVSLAKSPVGVLFSGLDGGAGTIISGVIYGNTSNPSGNGNGVLPSFAPGPWVCGNPLDCAGPTNPGGSMGAFLAPLASDGTAAPTFANNNDPDLDFSK